MERNTWHIIYVNRKYLSDENLERYQADYGIEIVVPMLWVLRRASKGKNDYVDVPYLFNLGFLRLPTRRRQDVDFLSTIKREVPLIIGYLRDTTKPKDGNNFAMVPTKEVNRLITDANNSSIYDNIEEVIKVGDIVEMNGYPWSGLDGEVMGLNKETETARIRIKKDNFDIKVEVPFYNICYTQYTTEIEGNTLREELIEDISPVKVNKIYATLSLNLEQDGGS